VLTPEFLIADANEAYLRAMDRTREDLLAGRKPPRPVASVELTRSVACSAAASPATRICAA
jgi:hypothetical protein